MKIPDYLTLKVSDAYLRQSQATQRKDRHDARATSELREPKKDEIILSARATEVRKFEGLVKTIPEVRQEKVEAVKRQIESRTYTVDGKLVAKGIADLLI